MSCWKQRNGSDTKKIGKKTLKYFVSKNIVFFSLLRGQTIFFHTGGGGDGGALHRGSFRASHPAAPDSISMFPIYLTVVHFFDCE